MKNWLLLSVLLFAIAACTSQKKITNKALFHGIVGQKEKIVYSRVGLPTEINTANEGEKVLVYEVSERMMVGYSKSIKPAVTSQFDMDGQRDYDVDVWQIGDALSDAKSNTEYRTNKAFLKVYIDSTGTCTGFEQNLPKLQQEYYYDRLKKYIPEE